MKVSVAICTYNGENFIREQLDSILNQSRPVDEIIICDDRSTDGTKSILEEYQKKHPELIEVVVNSENLRSVKNFEKALGLCSGNVIFLSDQDDVWAYTKVQAYLDYFEKHPNVFVLASDGYCIDEHSNRHEKYAIWQVPNFFTELGQKFDYYESISKIANIATGASMALRRDFLIDVLPFPMAAKFHHDEWIALIAASRNQFELLPEKYFSYRIHSKQQVGGVFYEKNKKSKNYLTARYNFDSTQFSFKQHIQRQKDLIRSYNKSKLLSAVDTNYKNLFFRNLDDILKLIKLNRNQLKMSYPIQFFLLCIYESIFKRNKIPKHN